MAKIGSFTVVQRAVAAAHPGPVEADTFDFEGQEFRVVTGQVSLLPMMEFANALYASDETEEMKALAACYDMLKWCIHPDDWARFRKAALTSGAGLDDLFMLSQAVWESVSGRPTNGPSASPDGPSNTGTSPKVSSAEPTAPRSSFKVDLPQPSPSMPDLRLLTPANDWTPPATMPGASPMTSVDDLVMGRASA